MNTAFEFAATPTSRSGIARIIRNRGARLAADAEEALVVLGQIVQFVAAGVFPDLSPGPIGKRTDFG